MNKYAINSYAMFLLPMRIEMDGNIEMNDVKESFQAKLKVLKHNTRVALFLRGGDVKQ